jgi:uncharacterized protein YdhG (YjbR/CyaY superfamily)
MSPKVDKTKPNPSILDEYIASQPEAMQPILQRVRTAIRNALPAAEEAISYSIPAFKLNGQAVIYFAAWKLHYSLYPCTAGIVDAFKDDLASYELSKGTIRFPASQPVPTTLIAAIARFRAREVADHRKTRAPKKRTRR